MQEMILICTLFLIAVVLILGILFVYLAYNLVGMTLPGSRSEDKTTAVGEDLMTPPDRVPIDQFIPRSDMPLKVRYSDKDTFTKEK